MLPSSSRLRSGADFEAAVRRGRRAGTRRLVVHLLLPDPPDTRHLVADPAADDPSSGRGAVPARVGFVVSRAVGGSVVRHRVARRLRAVVRPHLGDLPPGARVVVRAQAPAAFATSAELAADVSRCLARLDLRPNVGVR